MLINRNFNPNLNPGLVAEQTLRSCTFLLDPGVPISGPECGVSSEPDGFSDARMCVKEQVGIRWV